MLTFLLQLSRGLLKISPEPVKELYSLLDVTLDPLSLCSTITPLFNKLAEDANYAPYLPLLHRALLSRLPLGKLRPADMLLVGVVVAVVALLILPLPPLVLDMLIAATALEHSLTLVTENRKDFPMPELSLYPLPDDSA